MVIGGNYMHCAVFFADLVAKSLVVDVRAVMGAPSASFIL